MAGLDAWLGLTDDPINKQVQRVPHLHIARLDVRPIDRGLYVALDPAPVPLHRLDGLVEIVVVVRCRVQQDRLEVDGSPGHLETVLWNLGSGTFFWIRIYCSGSSKSERADKLNIT